MPVDAVADIPLTIGFKDTGNKPTPTPVDQANSQDTATASLEAPIVLARKSIETVPDKPKLIDKFNKPAGGSRSKLTVSVVPDDARIRIMNIVEKYKPGISLDRSKSYDVYVTRPGYESFRDKIKLTDDEQELAIVLPQRELSMPLTVPLSGGTFTMGCSKSDSQCQSYEKPAHSVSVDSFAMTKTEITVSQFSDFVNATGYVTDAEKNAGGNKGCFVWSDGGGISRSSSRWGWKAGTNWRKPGYAQKGNFPVTCVSWNDSVAYAKWLSNKSGRHFTLPTEAQWEYAARAGSDARYVASNNANSLCAHANVADRSLSPTGSKWSDRVACNDNYWFSAPVSSFKPNKLGLHDMQGNVWEWVDDVWASSFKNTPRNGMANTQGKSSDRVLRGGAWDGDEKRLRISNRSKASTSNRAAMTGFRLVAR
ncbi:MAG: formylglycine-generating enzyme family protein [Granulosicoccus sp.]